MFNGDFSGKVENWSIDDSIEKNEASSQSMYNITWYEIMPLCRSCVSMLDCRFNVESTKIKLILLDHLAYIVSVMPLEPFLCGEDEDCSFAFWPRMLKMFYYWCQASHRLHPS